MLHDQIATEKSSKILDRYLPELKEAIALGEIRNVDFTRIKDYMNFAYYMELNHVRDLIRASDIPDYETEKSLYFLVYEAADIIPYQLAHIGSVDKKLTRFRKQHPDLDPRVLSTIEKVEQITERWQSVDALLKSAKPLIVKGRKPVDPANRKTPIRTIDNTGTCSCCERNIKLHDDKIVDHGFTLAWGNRNGNCFGVGYAPLEIATDGLIAFRDHVQSQQKRAQEALSRHISGETTTLYKTHRRRPPVEIKRGEDGFEMELRRAIAEKEQQIGYLESIKERLDTRIANWEPSALPDGRSDHLASTSSP